jgi:hypothetical protein
MTNTATPKPPPSNMKTTAVFVDAVENGRARLLLGDDAFTVPAALLPEDAGEGSWLKLTATVTPPQVDPAALRRKLGRDDPGGPIKL